MNPFIQSYLSWASETTKSAQSIYPARYAAASLLASAENAYRYAHEASAKIASIEEMNAIATLSKDARYLAVLLGSTLFDSEMGEEFAFVAQPHNESLFGIGLGWLPLAVMLGCEMDASVENASINGGLSCYIPDIDYTFTLGSAAAKILTLDDLKVLAMKQIEDHAQCSPESLVDYLGKVAVADWDFAIAESGDSLLIAEGY